MPANRPADCRHISSDLDLFGREQLSGVLAHDHHDEAHIPDPKPWKPEAIAKSKKRGRTPLLQIAASDYHCHATRSIGSGLSANVDVPRRTLPLLTPLRVYR